jgi:hypothetical protein
MPTPPNEPAARCPACGYRPPADPADVRAVTLPLRTVSESNRRGAWGAHYPRESRQRRDVATALRGTLGVPTNAPALIRLVRIAPRALDRGNLEAAMKHAQDGVADWVGIDDRHLAWAYGQERGGAREYAVRVELEFLPGTAPAEVEAGYALVALPGDAP